MTSEEIDRAVIRHINLSGDMYSRLVFGEESQDKRFLFQKNVYIEDRPIVKWLNKLTGKEDSYIKPSFREIDKDEPYIYIVSLWGNLDVKKSILRELYRMKKRHSTSPRRWKSTSQVRSMCLTTGPTSM